MFIVFMVLSLYLSKTILAQWFDPRHAQLEFNKRLINLNLVVDSLAEEVDRKDQFIANIESIVSGEDINQAEVDDKTEVIANQVGNENTANTGDLPPIDDEIRREFEESGLDLLTLNSDEGELQEIFFFPPISGIISQAYDAQSSHLGVDIVSKKNEPVKAVADGTVIFSDFDFSDSGYVIAIQHRGNLISIYKHNSALLKKVGNFVSAGEIIAIIGNTGELTSGPHLHFELWYDGDHMNPEDYISF